MARGVEKSLWAVILEARGGHTNLKKMGLVEALFFSRSSESKWVGPWGAMVVNGLWSLKEDNRIYLKVFSEVREGVRREEELEGK